MMQRVTIIRREHDCSVLEMCTAAVMMATYEKCTVSISGVAELKFLSLLLQNRPGVQGTA